MDRKNTQNRQSGLTNSHITKATTLRDRYIREMYGKYMDAPTDEARKGTPNEDKSNKRTKINKRSQRDEEETNKQKPLKNKRRQIRPGEADDIKTQKVKAKKLLGNASYKMNQKSKRKPVSPGELKKSSSNGSSITSVENLRTRTPFLQTTSPRRFSFGKQSARRISIFEKASTRRISSEDRFSRPSIPVKKKKFVGDFSYGSLVGTSRWFKKRLQESDYDPYEHRHPLNATTNWETLFHIVKCCTSTGILTMPKAFQSAGLCNGLIWTVLIITLVNYCIHTLIKCQYLLCKRLTIPLITYPDTMMAALTVGPRFCRRIARYSKTFMECLIILNQMTVCAAYVLFVANNIKMVGDVYTGTHIMSLELYVLLLVIPFVLISLVRNMKTLASVSLLGNCATVLSCIIILYYITNDLPDIHDREMIGSAYNFPGVASIIIFGFDSLSSIIAAENNMQDPKSFRGFFGVLNVSMIMLTLVVSTMGFLGYWKYGEDVNYILTLNLPVQEKLSQIVMVVYSAAVIITYGIQESVPARIFMQRVRHSAHKLLWEYCIRLICALAPILIAATIPFLMFIMPFFGALCGTTLKFACPALIELCLKHSDHMGYGHWIALIDVCIIICAVIALVTGLYSSVHQSFVALHNHTITHFRS